MTAADSDVSIFLMTTTIAKPTAFSPVGNHLQGALSPNISEIWDTVANDVTQYGDEVYTEGDCWVLAWAIAQHLPESRVLLVGFPKTVQWFHVVVEVGENTYMDVTGLTNQEEIFKYWRGDALIEVDGGLPYTEFMKQIGVKNHLYPFTVPDALFVAAGLISRYL